MTNDQTVHIKKGEHAKLKVILELESATTEMKNSLKVFTGRFEQPGERISKLEDSTVTLLSLKNR